ncbi:membrane protein YdbS with pleckstrin-like domain [Natronocella acetinitrilica]|uniref:Membrane protein YdbS with pleckstrin-like domain n=1 Tax=Natronocella acetinitrilica TaxID=414046 RepID=A0AAE3KGY0_9GAMM|nr:hypothetical protein [Natronocella acetinitrilica]MCP1675742.1 membrane protein YdbS with pleckstrin-like domain [Natronocella acetinitrilica]
MPNHIKAILSLAVAVTAVIIYFFQASAGQELTKWLVLLLGMFMIVALWLFPETKKKGKGSS